MVRQFRAHTGQQVACSLDLETGGGEEWSIPGEDLTEGCLGKLLEAVGCQENAHMGSLPEH